MLEKSLATKQDLMKIVQAATIKNIFGADIDDQNDLKKFIKAAEDQLRSPDQLTLILITTKGATR